MAEQDQPYHQAGVQHLAYLAQTRHQSPTVSAHNPWEAGSEAHLQHKQHQVALVEVQHLERQRLKLLQDLAANQHL